jgi:hypothetical protein
MPVTIDIQFGGVAPAQFNSFLVGTGQPAIQAEIETTPADATVSWTITPTGAHSGTVAPNTGTTKTFNFTPNVTGARPTTGSLTPNDAIGYELQLTAAHATEGSGSATVSITQNMETILRQEYLDYGRPVPAANLIGTPTATANFTVAELTANNNYGTIIVRGGLAAVAQAIRTGYGRGLILSSAFRCPQRNRQVGGAAASIHMSGGAVDLHPLAADAGVTRMAELYRAAVTHDPGLVLLEQGPSQLLPGDWSPPGATHTFTVGTATIDVNDTDSDGLPDTISAINNPPTGGIARATDIPYDGNGTANPNFRAHGATATIQVGDTLVLDHPAGTQNSLSHYFSTATHVHADNRP